MQPVIIAYLCRIVLKILLWTCRFKISGKENLLLAIQNGPTIVAAWHNQLLLMAPSLLKSTKKEIFTAFISNSRDGNLLAAFTTSFQRGRAIRVSHNAKDRALRSLIARLKETREIPLITPDGPRGPRYQAKPGIVMAAKASNASIIPFFWRGKNYWELGTWDKFRIPKPFSTIEAFFGSPVKLEQQNPLEDDLKILQEKLNFQP